MSAQQPVIGVLRGRLEVIDRNKDRALPDIYVRTVADACVHDVA